MADITIIGADKLTRNIAKRVGRDRVNGVIKKSAAKVQENAVRIVPVAPYMGGTLKRSISIELQPMFLSAEVTANTEYAGYVEYGTRYMDAQPYMRPARSQQAPIFLNDLRNLIRKG